VLIGELARRADVNIQTIRFYERQKLLPPPARKPSGYRIYGDGDLRRLLFIRQAKALGFSLEEIREIVVMRARGACPCGRVVSLAERHLDNIRETIRSLAGFEKELTRAVNKWKSSGRPRLAANEFCALIERAMSAEKKEAKR
jgi:MerR family transcriptional regulator, mercuric resistance operon regulatory protein